MSCVTWMHHSEWTDEMTEPAGTFFSVVLSGFWGVLVFFCSSDQFWNQNTWTTWQNHAGPGWSELLKGFQQLSNVCVKHLVFSHWFWFFFLLEPKGTGFRRIIISIFLPSGPHQNHEAEERRELRRDVGVLPAAHLDFALFGPGSHLETLYG